MGFPPFEFLPLREFVFASPAFAFSPDLHIVASLPNI